MAENNAKKAEYQREKLIRGYRNEAGVSAK